MDAKTIVLHVDKDTDVEQILNVTIPLAIAAKSHLVGVFAMPAIPHGSDVVGPFRETLIADYKTEYEPINEAKRATFEKMCAGLAFTYEWRFLPGPFMTLEEAILPESRAADFTVASLGPHPEDALDLRNIPQTLLTCGRPVVLVPPTGDFSLVDTTVTIAWNNTREATRAVFDAIPLLQRAKSIRLVTIGEQHFGKSKQDPLSGADMANALSRHGLDVDVTVRDAGSDSVGETLIKEVTNGGANLLVMGAYGHSRFRELVLGGATRHVLAHITIPVLFAH